MILFNHDWFHSWDTLFPLLGLRGLGGKGPVDRSRTGSLDGPYGARLVPRLIGTAGQNPSVWVVRFRNRSMLRID